MMQEISSRHTLPSEECYSSKKWLPEFYYPIHHTPGILERPGGFFTKALDEMARMYSIFQKPHTTSTSTKNSKKCYPQKIISFSMIAIKVTNLKEQLRQLLRWID
jgi:hypothetical protein